MVLVATPLLDGGPLAVDLPEVVPPTLVGVGVLVTGLRGTGPLPDESGFYVEDDGIGVPPSRERVFEGGYSTDETGPVRIRRRPADRGGPRLDGDRR